MDYLTAILGVPLALGVLTVGAGLLVYRLSGRWFPLTLVPLTGLAALICVGQVTTAFSAAAPATVVVGPALAVAGLWLGRAELRPALSRLRRSPWPLLVLAITYLIAIGPVLAAGRPTLAAYLLDSTAGVQIAGADWLVAHGRDFTSLPESSYRGYLEAYFGNQYPSGAHVLLGLLTRLLPTSALWLYQPFLASMLAFCAPSLWFVLRRFGAPQAVAVAGAVVAALPALVYAYALMGAIKEISLLPLLLGLLAFVVLGPQWLRGPARAVLPMALVAGAGLGVVGLAFGAWLAVAAAILIVTSAALLRTRKVRAAALARQVAVLAAVVALAALPTLIDLASSLTLATNLSQSNTAFASDPGNLLQPIRWVQGFGAWLGGTHRLNPPEHFWATLAFIAVTGMAAAFGTIALGRRRFWAGLAFFIGSGIVWWALTERGTTWTDAKLIVLSSPLVLLLAFVGVGELARAGRRPEAALVGVAVSVGVLWSDALLYHDTNLAPTERFDEQATINARFAGEGPALLPDFDEYALFMLRDLAPSGPGFARKPEHISTLRTGTGVPYGTSVDLDTLSIDQILQFPLLVVRRSPERSLAPTGYELAWRGASYDVWRRTASAERVREHVGTQGYGRPIATVPCGTLRRLAKTDDARFVVATRERTVLGDPLEGARSGSWSQSPAGGLGIVGPGRLQVQVHVPQSGRYRLWLKGDFGRPFQITIDGRSIGSVGYDSGGQASFARPLDVELDAGRHRIDLVRGGGSLAPGDGQPSRVSLIVLEPMWQSAAPRSAVVSAEQLRSNCGRPVDWVEVVADGASG